MTNTTAYTITKDVPLLPIQISDVIDFVETSIAVVEQCRHADNGWHRGYLAAMDDVLEQLI
jgi:hypothetical protein